jgi:hypothetical protein
VSTARRVGAGGALVTALMLALAGCGGSPTAAPRAPAASGPRASATATSGTATIPRALARGERPIGAGPRFHPAARGPVIGH